MTRPMRLGSLCTGIGGLEHGLTLAGLDTDTVFVSDIDKGACAWLEANMPNTPNLGDFTELNELPEVDILTAGFPCQPVSNAGLRAGINDERWLFDDITRLVGRMGSRPYVFLENVPGLLTANNGNAMARVVHGLAGIGYHITYGTLSASAVGAPHRRLRWWGLAFHADSVAGPTAGERTDRTGRKPEVYGTNTGLVRDVADALGAGQQQSWTQTDQTGRGRSAGRSGGVAADADSFAAGRNSGATLSSQEQARRQPHSGDRPRNGDRRAEFGQYADAVHQWGCLLGRTAPHPTINGRLAPPFVEWMMGYPEGWVTDTLTSRRQALHALGNAVVPQCAAAAFQQLTARL